VTILVAALLARLAGAGQALTGGELVTLDGDSLYHLRRMRIIAEAFPRVPWVDPMIAWPDGAPIPWAAGFDLLGAVMIRLGRAIGGEAGGDLWVAGLCPLLGLAVVAAVMELVHSLRPGAPGQRAAALAAGVLASALPQGLAISRYGVIDHHVAEALSMLLLARWALAALPPRSEQGCGRRAAFELAGAALSGGAVAVFTGSALYVALVLPILLGAALAAPRPALVGSGGPGLLAGAALAALASAPAVAAHGRALAFGFPSWLQPLLLAVAGAAVCCAVLAGGRTAPGSRRLVAMLACAGAVAGLAAVAAPLAGAQAMAGIREWLLTGDPWLRGIDEFQPLLRNPAGPAGGVNRFLGAAGFAAPLLLPLAFLGARPAGGARASAFLWATLALAMLTLLQSRFGRLFIPFLAAAAGLGLTWLVTRVAPRARLAASVPVAAALGVALLDPQVRASAGAPDDLPDAAREAAFDLRARAPGPAPGVLAPWDLGNQFLVLAGRPVVATGFGPYPDPSAYWEGVKAFTVGEQELLPWLNGRRVGWVVAGAANLFARVKARDAPIPFAGRGFSPQWLKEVASAPLLIGGSGVPALGVRHFGHLLPVFASTRTVVGIDAPLPVLWTYEVVPGARLSGRASPGARVVLEVPLTEHGRRHTWRAFADAGADGHWTMTVPLPTDLATPTITTGRGTLRLAGGRDLPVRIQEAAVRAGSAVDAEALLATP
jgi:dolichyl-diphosphooligosaccharide--protein glycosyltransferase